MFSSIRVPKYLISLVVLGLLTFSTTIVSAVDTTSAVTITEVEITNPSTTQSNIALPISLSTQSFLDGGYVNTTVLNSAVQEIGVDLPYMPGSKLLTVKSAQDYNGVSYNDITGAVNDSSTTFVLPSSLDDTIEFGLQYKSTILRFDTSTPGSGVYTITWEYHDGSTWTALQNVVDNTDSFKVSGVTTVTYDIPANWVYYNHPTHGLEAFWIRARISAFTSQTTAPIATNGAHETGQWWTFHSTVEQDVLKTAKLYFGGPDMQTYFSYFPGNTGIITPDSTTIEPSNQFKWNMEGYFNLSTTGASKDIINKAGSIRLYQSNINELTFTMTGVGNYSIDPTNNDSYMENLEAIYPRARDEDNAGAVYNSNSTLKIGQSYDKDTDSIPAFGDKINDPS